VNQLQVPAYFCAVKTPVLVLAPHTDDGELGCGATIARLIAEGHEVWYAAFSACELSVPSHLPKDILITEVKKATATLGILPERLILFNYEVRTFNYHRQDILQNLIDLRKQINPQLVFIPSLNDLHQDHQTIAHEALRAFKETALLSYELPWNNLSFNTTFFYKLTEEQLDTKARAMAQYESQQHRSYANKEFIFSLARTRGVQVNTRFAEVFEVVRWVE
jgi:LmbE family N-acetylglucosaminyl deacetylase